METIGLCQCGCGGETGLARQNDKKWGYIKGKSVNFIVGHNALRKGCTHSNGYLLTRAVNHPRSNKDHYVPDHVLIAERALGKHIASEHSVHHFPQLKNFIHLVICENNGYHNTLHRRYRALKACGHPNWRKCSYCKEWDDPQNLYIKCRGIYHRKCIAAHSLSKRRMEL